MKRWLPMLLVVSFAAWVLSTLSPPAEKTGFHERDFGKLPVLLNGRIQPLDSVARNSLLLIRQRQSVALDNGQTLSALDWLLEVLMKPETADTRKVFRIIHPEVQALLKLPDTDKYFSFLQLKPELEALLKQDEGIRQKQEESGKEEQTLSVFEKQVRQLVQAVTLYHRLKNSLQPEGARDFAREIELYHQALVPGLAAVRAQQAGETYDEHAFGAIINFLSYFKFQSEIAYPLLVPPQPKESREAWTNVGTSLMEAAKRNEIHPAVQFYAAMSTAYRNAQAAEFNQALVQYQQWLSANQLAPEITKGQREFFYNDFQPFYKCMVIYVVAFLLGCMFWLNLTPWLRTSALALVLLALVIHTSGLIFRMVLEHRPPVTNLYSSAIFIGWGAVILGTVLERFFKDGIGIVVASLIGFSTLIIAHNLALGGDTMEMLRAVLDTNFWLATHVVAVTTGYAATFVAGILAVIYILRGVLTRSLSETQAKSLATMVYGIVCFATLFSFVGTVLGGIWADQSWGRFWGWDPKENGALMIVIWNAAFLHARWGKVFPERGLIAMAIFGNIVTSFSWFGVNMLGIGLHSYGFMDQAFNWLVAFDVTQIILIALALLPKRFWASFREQAAVKPVQGK